MHAFLTVYLCTALKLKLVVDTDRNVSFNLQVRLMISDTARHKLLVLSGQSSENTGDLILQTGSFSFCNFIDIFTDQEASKHIRLTLALMGFQYIFAPQLLCLLVLWKPFIMYFIVTLNISSILQHAMFKYIHFSFCTDW